MDARAACGDAPPSRSPCAAGAGHEGRAFAISTATRPIHRSSSTAASSSSARAAGSRSRRSTHGLTAARSCFSIQLRSIPRAKRRSATSVATASISARTTTRRTEADGGKLCEARVRRVDDTDSRAVERSRRGDGDARLRCSDDARGRAVAPRRVRPRRQEAARRRTAPIRLSSTSMADSTSPSTRSTSEAIRRSSTAAACSSTRAFAEEASTARSGTSRRCSRESRTFDDTIAVAEWLVREGYTKPAKLAVEGGSNGGLTVGAVLTQRPDLFAAAICQCRCSTWCATRNF